MDEAQHIPADEEPVPADEDYIPRTETVEAFEECLDRADTVAVVAAPWSGRDALLDRAAELSDDVERVTLDAPVEESPPLPDSECVLVENCHHLYRRGIDGFAPLDQLCRAVATTRGTVVTSWNRTAWSYLAATTTVTQAFDEVFEIPPLSSDEAEALLLATTDTEDPEAELAAYAEYPPTPESRADWVRLRLRRLYRGTVVDHLDGLVEDAAGNPRTIRTLFTYRTKRGIDGRPGAPDVGYDSSYLLWLVLSNERISVEELASLAGRPVEADLASLARQGVVTRSGGDLTIPSEAFGDVLAHLERRRLAW